MLSVKKLKDLLSKATPGPWRYDDNEGYGITRILGAAELTSGGNSVADVIGDCADTEYNAALIVASRNALPDLIAEIEQLEDKNLVLGNYAVKLEQIRDNLSGELLEAHERIESLEAALRFYADPDLYEQIDIAGPLIEDRDENGDYGRHARAALEAKK